MTDSLLKLKEGSVCCCPWGQRHTHCSRALQGTGRVKTRYVPLRGYRDAMQWGQVGLEGPAALGHGSAGPAAGCQLF